MLRLKTDAELRALFDALILKISAANHAKPRTFQTKATAKSLLVQARKVSAEMSRRSGVDLAIVAAIDNATAQVQSVATGAVAIVSSIGSKVVLALALVGFIMYQVEK